MAKDKADFTNLTSGQLGGLQQMLQDFTTGQATSEPIDDSEEPSCCHSSHFDNDGWF